MKTAALEKLLASATEIGESLVGPRASLTDEEAQWPAEAMAALQSAGFGGLVIAQEDGGQGQGLYGLARVCETLGQHCTSTALCFGMHSVGSAVLAAKATPEQKKMFVEPIASGEHITTLSLSEPGSGAHFYFPETEIHKTADGAFELTGTKSFVTNGSFADSYVVSAVATDSDSPAGEFSMLVLPEGTDGMKWGAPWDGMGMRGNSSRNLQLEQTKVPTSHLLGRPGDQIWYVFEVVAPFFLMAMSGSFIGLAQVALDEAVTHLKSRNYTHSGTHLSQISVLQHRVGTLCSVVERTRQLVYHGARLGDAGKPGALSAILSAKAEAADCVTFVVNEAMTLMGGKAYGFNSKMDRLLRDARAAHVMGPTTDILRTWTGRAILDLPLLGD